VIEYRSDAPGFVLARFQRQKSRSRREIRDDDPFSRIRYELSDPGFWKAPQAGIQFVSI